MITRPLPPSPGLTLAANSCRLRPRPSALCSRSKNSPRPPARARHLAMTIDHSRIESKLFVIGQNGNGSYRRRVIPVSPLTLWPISLQSPVTCLSEDRWRMMFLSRAGTGRWTRSPGAGQETGSAKSSQQLETVKGFRNAGYAK